MSLFYYDSFNKRGGRVTGKIDATSAAAAKEMLRGQGLMPVSIKEITAGSEGFSLSTLFEKKVDFKSIILFTKQLSVLLRSGVPLLQAIELLMEQFEGSMQRILVSVKDGIKSGESFASELAKHPKVFSNVYVQLTRAGEASGKLDVILDRLTGYLERSEDTRRRIKSAMSYPTMLLGFAIAIVVGVLMFLVPRMTDMFIKSGKDLPGPTQLMVNMSNALINHYMILLAIVTSVVGLFLYWRSTPQGKYRIDEILLRTPLISYFVKTKAVVQFCKTLGMLLESGVHLPEALDIVSNIVDNKVLVHKLTEARDKIIKEGKIAKYLKETGLFPAIASYMISTGEQSGKLAQMLLTVGNDYDVELTEITDSLTSKITPIMTVVMATIVLFIVLAIFLPIMEMGDVAGM